MDETIIIRQYKDRLRIFLILYFFSDEYQDINNPRHKKIFKSEVKIQKVDFLLRNPDYLAYELILFAQENKFDLLEIKNTVNHIFKNNEPYLKRLEMEKFFFGAYEDIDDVVSFLKSIDFIDFSSKKNVNLQTIEKYYYITELAIQKVESNLSKNSSLQWYVERCNLIKKYFGDLSGSQLKIMQYKIPEYKNTGYNEYIGSIQDEVRHEYQKMFGEVLA